MWIKNYEKKRVMREIIMHTVVKRFIDKNKKLLEWKSSRKHIYVIGTTEVWKIPLT